MAKAVAKKKPRNETTAIRNCITCICAPRRQRDVIKRAHRNTHRNAHAGLFFPFSQTKLVLINLAGGTRHVFPFTSWPPPPSGSVEAINSSLSAVCLFEFFANPYYSPMALLASRRKWRARAVALFILLGRHTSCLLFFPPPSKKKKKRVSWLLCPPLLLEPEGSLFVNSSICCPARQRKGRVTTGLSGNQPVGAQNVSDCVTRRDKCFSSPLAEPPTFPPLSRTHTLQLITPLTIFYQKVHRS